MKRNFLRLLCALVFCPLLASCADLSVNSALGESDVPGPASASLSPFSESNAASGEQDLAALETGLQEYLDQFIPYYHTPQETFQPKDIDIFFCLIQSYQYCVENQIDLKETEDYFYLIPTEIVKSTGEKLFPVSEYTPPQGFHYDAESQCYRYATDHCFPIVEFEVREITLNGTSADCVAHIGKTQQEAMDLKYTFELVDTGENTPIYKIVRICKI